ncbi:MAG TPA: tetratricopeptide repeat protein [Clostridia bacterium]|nr:tetratricopeptide repeat protein [Clostridia bacterium]
MSRRTQAQATPPQGYWSASQAYILAVITLVVGFAAGYFFHGSGQTVTPISSSTPQVAMPPSQDAMVTPLLRQLEAMPRDPALLAQIGNTYYDAKDYANAIEYYRRSLENKPDSVDVRTDMGTAMWYSGDPDGALREFEKSLQYQPNHGHTLFNRGIVRWQGKNDVQGALASWNQLLASNPGYPERQKVEQLIRQLKSEGS